MPKKVVVSGAHMRARAETILGEAVIGSVGRRVRTAEAQLRRCAQMSILYHDHAWSLEQVGMAYGISRERVRQIFDEYNLPTRAPNGHQTYDEVTQRREAVLRLREQVGDAAD